MIKRLKRTETVTKKDLDETVEELAQVTQRAFERVEKDMGELRRDVKELKGDVGELKDDVASLKRGQQAMLDVIHGIDERLREQKDLPERVTRLGNAVFR